MRPHSAAVGRVSPAVAYRGAVNLPDVLSLARSLMEEADVATGTWLSTGRVGGPARRIMLDVGSRSAATS